MQLIKEYRIDQLHAARFSNAPYKFLLETSGSGFPDKVGELVMDSDACQRHGITPSLDLVGRKLKCTFTPRVPRESKHEGEPVNDENWLGLDDVMIGHFQKVEKWEGMRWSIGELKQEVSYSLTVYSDDGTDGIHPMPTNCPLYNLHVELNEEEYTILTKLAPKTVFRMSFELLPDDRDQTKESEE